MNDQNFVDVEPLQPPFVGEVWTFKFYGGNKLAVSSADRDRLRALFESSGFIDRMVTLSAADDGRRIRVSVVVL